MASAALATMVAATGGTIARRSAARFQRVRAPAPAAVGFAVVVDVENIDGIGGPDGSGGGGWRWRWRGGRSQPPPRDGGLASSCWIGRDDNNDGRRRRRERGVVRRTKAPVSPPTSSFTFVRGGRGESRGRRRPPHLVRARAHPRGISSLSKAAATAPPDAPLSMRWTAAVPPAALVHLSIGGVYAYGMWTPGLVRIVGTVASAPADWTHAEVLPAFSCAALVLGVTTSFLGPWVERVGPRTSGMVGSAFWCSALIVSAAGAHLHSLPLLYAGYGALGGVGWGLMYLTPVTAVMKWFPDRRGLATGMALSAFGLGAAIAPGIIQGLTDACFVAPEFVGPVISDLADACAGKGGVLLEALPDGSQAVASNSPAGAPGTPVVVATESDLLKLSPSYASSSDGSGGPLRPGAYVTGTGDAGVAGALACLGVAYGTVGAVGSRFLTMPHPGWTPPIKEGGGGTGGDAAPPSAAGEETPAAVGSDRTNANPVDFGLPASYATTQTVQFPLLWLAVFGNATGGLALLASSKLLLTDVWASAALAGPAIVTPSFATGYVGALGVGMAAGRFGWSILSDGIGRRATYGIFGLGIPIVGMAPLLCRSAAEAAAGGGVEGAVWPYLATFYSGSVLAITFYGGVFSVLPAYIADLFGQKHAGAIHGKALTAWAASAVAGPMGLAFLRSRAVDRGTDELLDAVTAAGPSSTDAFERSFGCRPDDAGAVRTLVDAKTITIERLMELAPPGTLDPTPFLYDTTCYAAAGLMGMAALANLMIRPLDLDGILARLERESRVEGEVQNEDVPSKREGNGRKGMAT